MPPLMIALEPTATDAQHGHPGMAIMRLRKGLPLIHRMQSRMAASIAKRAL